MRRGSSGQASTAGKFVCVECHKVGVEEEEEEEEEHRVKKDRVTEHKAKMSDAAQSKERDRGVTSSQLEDCDARTAARRSDPSTAGESTWGRRSPHQAWGKGGLV
jgi:uncharacterized Zn finger protein (UPF0148 family)